MFLQSEMKSALKTADALIARRNKIASVIATEVEKLTGLVQRLMAAKSEDADAEAAQLLDGAMPEREGRRADPVRSEIRRAGDRLNSLRAAIAALVPNLIRTARAVEGEIESHHREIEKKFAREWEDASKAFSLVLGKRAVIEKTLGRPLSLGGPMAVDPAPEAVAEIIMPRDILSTLRELVEKGGAMAPSSGIRRIPFDSEQVYISRKIIVDANGPPLAPGTFLVEACLEPGWLDFYVGVQSVVRADDERCIVAQEAASNERLRIGALETERRNAASLGPAADALDSRPITSRR
jgi:hypothetical protein